MSSDSPVGASDTVLYVTIDRARDAAIVLSGAERGVLDQLNERLGARQSLPEILDFLAESLHGLAPCDRFSFAFVEEDGTRIVSRYTRAFYEPVVLGAGYTEDVASSSLLAVIRRGVPRIIGDLVTYLAAHPHSRSTHALVKEGVRSNLTCPLMVEGRVVGLLFRSARRPHAYGPRDVLLHLAIADRLAQVVEQVWRREQLAASLHAYNELLAFITHELRSPIASMLTEAGLLLDGYLGELPPAHRVRLEKLVAKGQYAMSLVRDYLELARIEGGNLRADPRPGINLLRDVVGPAIEVVGTPAELKRQRITVVGGDGLPPVELDPQLIKIVLINLLSNAVKYGAPDSEIVLTISFGGGRLLVAVRNQGHGFSPADRSKLFRRFSRLAAPELARQMGTGVGLYTSWRIIRLHGGRMDARSEPGAWAEFWFEVPQPLGSPLPATEPA